jgi:c-di-GMP-binding flagellar brake protein YcgR
MTEEDRRRYFRVKDQVQLKIKFISPDEVDERLEEWDKGYSVGPSLLASMIAINQNISLLLSEIKHKHPSITKLFELQNEKMDLIARSISLEGMPSQDDLVEVDLSAVGMKFYRPEIFKPGDMLELEMFLHPSVVRVQIIAEVVACKHTAEGQYSIGVNFSRVHESDQEVLIKHVVSKQYSELIEKRNKLDR